MNIRFNPELNYIGATDRQHKLTNWIAKAYKDINFTAAKHDLHYALMLADKNSCVRFIMKIMYDLVFLVLGIARLIKNFRFDGIPILFILYLCLLVSSPVYLWIKRKEYINLTTGIKMFK